MAEDYRPIPGFHIIAESINDSVPTTHELFEKGDIAGIVALAQAQAEGGAAFIDVNIGKRDPKFMGEVVRAIQKTVRCPLSIDSPDVNIQREGLSAYDPSLGNGMPLVNSISEMRLEILELNKIQPFRAILICTERVENGSGQPNKTPQEIYETACRLRKLVCSAPYNFNNDRIVFDPGVAPIGADFEGLTLCTLDAMKLIHNDPELKGVHMSVGLSNFTQMLPQKRANGELVKTPLESAFLTLAMPFGLDYSIASTKKKYRILREGDDALTTLKEALAAGGMETVMRIQEFYS
ncbi:MAG: dihydropteroate synthase [Fibrobacterota bacterium]